MGWFQCIWSHASRTVWGYKPVCTRPRRGPLPRVRAPGPSSIAKFVSSSIMQQPTHTSEVLPSHVMAEKNNNGCVKLCEGPTRICFVRSICLFFFKFWRLMYLSGNSSIGMFYDKERSGFFDTLYLVPKDCKPRFSWVFSGRCYLAGTRSCCKQ